MDQHSRARGHSVRGGMLLVLVLVCTAMFVMGPLRAVEPAMALLPDSGLQRKQLLAEARRTNQLLGEIKQLLTIMARDGASLGLSKETSGNSLRSKGPQKRR